MGIRTVVRRHFKVLWRSPHRWFDLTVWPLVDVIVWGALGAFVAQENSASRAGTPYLLRHHVVPRSLPEPDRGFDRGEERWSRNLLNMMTTPLREIEYALGLALYGLAKLAMGMTAVVLTAVAFLGFNLGEVGGGCRPRTPSPPPGRSSMATPCRGASWHWASPDPRSPPPPWLRHAVLVSRASR
ncbi:MAG: hypothetical protein ACRD0U_04880 [Acidimicrobiales bacterium]